MTVRIRKAIRHDLPKIAELIRTTLLAVSTKHYPKRIINNIVNSYTEKALETKIKTRTIFVATLGNKIVGTIYLTKDGWIGAMFVQMEKQNLGIGTKLMRKLEQTAKENGFRVLRAHVAINSIGFYKKLGFRTVKKVELKKAGKVYRIIKRLR